MAMGPSSGRRRVSSFTDAAEWALYALLAFNAFSLGGAPRWTLWATAARGNVTLMSERIVAVSGAKQQLHALGNRCVVQQAV